MAYDYPDLDIEPIDHCRDGTLALYLLCVKWDSSFRALGCHNDRNIRGSDQPSLHKVGRAFDVGIDTISPQSKKSMDHLVDTLILFPGPEVVQQIIWYRRIWRSGIGWREFDGASGPHTDHAHVELTIWGADYPERWTPDNVQEIIAMGDEPMTPEDYAGIAKAIIEYPIETTYDVGTPNQHQVTSNVGAILANIGIQLDRLVRASEQ